MGTCLGKQTRHGKKQCTKQADSDADQSKQDESLGPVSSVVGKIDVVGSENKVTEDEKCVGEKSVVSRSLAKVGGKAGNENTVPIEGKSGQQSNIDKVEELPPQENKRISSTTCVGHKLFGTGEGSQNTEEKKGIGNEANSHFNHGAVIQSLPNTPVGHCSENIDRVSNDMTSEGEEETRILVSRTWQEIDRIRHKLLQLNNNRPKQTSTGWRAVRIFVSSTFSDFHTEREAVVKRIVPKLNLWCKSRMIHLIECDLRWGIPKDTTTEETIGICLEEIERCLVETEGQAFFLNFLGHRYGWVPNYDLLSHDIKAKYNLVKNTSITHMEILHGAIGSNSKNAAFFIRDGSLLPQIPDEYKALFSDQTELGRQSLRKLKEELRRRFPNQVFDYECCFKEVDSSSGFDRVILDHLEDFESKCMTFFKNAIDEHYPDDVKKMESHEVAIVQQDHFVEMKSSSLIGRQSEKNAILKFLSVHDDDDDAQGDNPKCSHPDLDDSKNYLLVTGCPGIGKSALLASVVKELKSRGIICLYNFASATPGSTISTYSVDLFSKQLLRYFGLNIDKYDNLSNTEQLAKFKDMVKMLIDKDMHVVFVFDAINQFSDDLAMSMCWMPQDLRGNVKCLLSCTDDDPLHRVIAQHNTEQAWYSELNIRGFDAEKSKQCVAAYLGKYTKRLDDDQMSILLSNRGASNPLWLSLSCEELRLFGVFERLTEKIKQLPDSLNGLIDVIIDRVVAEDDTGLVKDAMCLLVCSTSGLTATELQWSLAEDGEKLAYMTWARCRALLQPYLISTGKTRDQENLNFFHNSVKSLVNEKYLQNPNDKRRYHQRIATMLLRSDDEDRTADELPTQLLSASDHAGLVKFLRNDKRSRRVNPIQRSRYLSKLRCTGTVSSTDKNFSFPVYICNMCSSRMQALTPTPGQNKDMCIVCGTLVPFKKDNHLAFLCMRHRQRTTPGNANCYICRAVIFLSIKAVPYSQMYLCMSCNCRGQKCVHLEY
eukprot:gene8782-9721_t